MTKHSTLRTAAQHEDNHGWIYKQNGSLFIARTFSRGVPVAYSGARTAIARFSPDAARRMRSYLRACMAEYRSMVTLTYPSSYPSSGPVVKEHLRRFLQELRRKYQREHTEHDSARWSAFWFLEFQERGAPHFHVFCTDVAIDRRWVSKTWYRIVGSDDDRHLRAGTRCEILRRGRAGTISYASKYAAKAAQKDVPAEYTNVGRFWGIWGFSAVLSADTAVTARDISDPAIQRKVSRMKATLSHAILEGKARVLFRKEGVFVVLVTDAATRTKLELEICQLSALTQRMRGYYDGADITQ